MTRDDASEKLGVFLRALLASKVTSLALAVGALSATRVALAQLATLAWPIHFAEGHQWRQSFTYGVAWNFAHESLDPFRPRMFVELTRSNIVAMEPPLYPLVSSFFLRVSDSVAGPRILSWLSLVAIVVVLFEWLSPAGEKGVRAWAERAGVLLALSVSPMVNVEFRSLQPEPATAALALVAAFWCARYAETHRARDGVLGVLFGGLALFTKPLALAVLPSLVVFAAWPAEGKRRSALTRAAVMIAGLAIFVALWKAWDGWAHHLKKTELEGQIFIAIEHDAKEMIARIRSGTYSREALLHFAPEYAGSWWLVPAYVAGLYRALAEARHRRYAIPLIVWLGGYFVELLAVGDRLHSNGYYFILAPAPLAYFGALGLGAMIRCIDATERRPSIPVFVTGFAVACLLPLGITFGQKSNWASIELDALGFNRNRGVWTSDLGLARLLLGFVVALALAPALRPRRLPDWIGVPLLVSILGTGVWAARDAEQYFRYYVAAPKRATYAAEVSELRRVVEQHVPQSERVVAGPGGRVRSPNIIYFYLMRRDGFPVTDGDGPELFEKARARGAHLYFVHDPIATEKVPVAFPLVAEGAWWRLFCIADDGCPPRGPAR